MGKELKNKPILEKWDYIFLMGESGGGKGTLVENIKKFWLSNIHSASMGDIFREKAKSDPEIKRLTEEGNLVSDDYVLSLFKELANQTAPGIIDGFPRNRDQALSAIKFIKEKGWRVLVIDLRCDIEVIIERLLSRGRADDKLAIMYKRNLDHKTLHPTVMAELKSRHDLFDIITLNGNTDADVTFTNFLLEVLRLVDMLSLYDMTVPSLVFKVSKNETNVNGAVNRCLCDTLIHIQNKMEKQEN